jgi:hypothetical protein
MSRRTTLLSALVVLVVAAAGLAILLTSQEKLPPQACNLPKSLGTANAGTAASAPDGGGIRVAEKGFTQLKQQPPGVSAGAMLENTSAMVAYRTRVVLRILDSAGRPATTSESPQLLQEIPIILPGQRIGVGSHAYLAGGTDKIASFEVELQAAQWFSRETIAGYTGASGTFKQIHRFDPVDTEPAYIDYTATVSSCRALSPRMVAAVYRDASGAVIGGTLEASAQRGNFLCEPGSNGDWIGAVGLPPSVQPDRTQFFPYCDVAQRPIPAASGGPWN